MIHICPHGTAGFLPAKVGGTKNHRKERVISMWFRSCSFLISMPDRYDLAYLGGQAPKCWKGGIQTILACFRSTVSEKWLCYMLCSTALALICIDYHWLLSLSLSSCPYALEQRCDGHFFGGNPVSGHEIARADECLRASDENPHGLTKRHKWRALKSYAWWPKPHIFTATILPQLVKLLATDWQPPAYRARTV